MSCHLKYLNCFCCIFVLLFMLGGCAEQKKSPPMCKKGVLDLSGWDLEKDGNLNLNGEWEFYWQQLLGPEKFVGDHNIKMTSFFTVPSIWNNFPKDKKSLPGNGYATFRLLIQGVPDDIIKGIRIKCLSTSYILYINGKKIAQNGIVGKSPQTTIPQFLLQEKSFSNNGKVLDVILQVANFNHRRGGISHPILFGAAENLKASHKVQWFFDIALFGCLFIMGIYYLSLFFLHKEDSSPLFLSLVTLNFALRILVTDNYYLTQVFPAMSWELLYAIELSTIIVGTTAILLFITSLFGQDRKLYFKYFLISCTSILFLITLVAPARISSHLVQPSQIVTLLIFAYCFYILLRSIKKDSKKAGIMLFGFSILFATAVADILNANQIIYFSFLAHFGILGLIFSQSLVLSVRFSDAFKKLTQLSRELGEKNITLKRLDKLKDEFLTNTTHELHTPLNGMVGIAENLKIEIGKKQDSEIAVSSLQMIISSGKRLSNLVNDVLDFSRLKNSDVTLNCSSVDLRTMTNVIFSVMCPLIGDKPLELVNDVSPDIPSIYGDEDRLQQILYNLLGNAIKFTDQGLIKINAAVCGSLVEVTVADTGRGISTERLKNIFEPYEQGQDSFSKNYGGIGLGLTITEKLVTLHGGSIWADSTPGKGSNFSFSIPVSEKPASASLLERKLTVLNGSQNEELVIMDYLSNLSDTAPFEESVLIVDDDPINLKVVANHLSTESIPFTTASDGQKALLMIEKKGAPALVLLDIMMPIINGYEVCKQLRINFSPAELPIILLTAKNRIEDLVDGFKVGGNDYLSKPFSCDELLARIHTHLKVKDAYNTMQENLSLKREINQRRRTEQDLRQTHRRLSRMLDTIKDAVLAVNESREICFCNKPFEEITGYKSKDLIGKPISSIIGRDVKRSFDIDKIFEYKEKGQRPGSVYNFSFSCPGNNNYPVMLQAASLDLDNEQLIMLVAFDRHGQNRVAERHEVRHLAIEAIKELNQNLERFRNLESLSHLTSLNIEENPSFGEKLHSIDQALANLAHELDFDMDMQEKRMMAVSLMNDLLEYWQNTTGLGKAEMARRSELWKVYMDYNGWERTQTLDKYFDLKMLPNRPRWKQIIKTADFVLTECDHASSLRDNIESTLRQLRVHV